MKLSIIIPVYNEIQTIGRVLVAVIAALPDVEKEIVVVDDGSGDGTREWLRRNVPGGRRLLAGCTLDVNGNLAPGAASGGLTTTELQTEYHERNTGKGGALRTGLTLVTGDVVVVQDADLEYDPRDLRRMYRLIAEQKVADVVYGSRFNGEPHRSLYFHHFLANRLISVLFNLLYNQTLTDVEVCYKMFTRDVLKTLRITCADFGFEIQISAQIARARRWRIYEVGISYYGRTYQEGKKIGWRDGLRALGYLVRFRLS
jgi:glycosyltransferase involved in cell wall biosynthesis